MAKKKTAIVEAVPAIVEAVPAIKNTVRNAVNKIWRVVNRLDNDNIIGIMYNANTKEFSAVNEVTGEELSGGGGGTALKGLISINIVNNSDQTIYASPDLSRYPATPIMVIDGILCATPPAEIDLTYEVQPESSKHIDFYVVSYSDGEKDHTEIDPIYLVQRVDPESDPLTVYEVTDLVNCAYENTKIDIVDLTAAASCTVVYKSISQ